MRSAPPLQLSVRRYGLWRAAVLLLAAGACASMLAWWSAQPQPAPRWTSAVALSAALATVVCAVTLWRRRPLTLRWDRQRWLVAQGGAAEESGETAVAIDLGAWMLLRFVPDRENPGRATRRRPMWIALQRYGLEERWHALRCALYAARPPRQPDVAAGDA